MTKSEVILEVALQEMAGRSPIRRTAAALLQIQQSMVDSAKAALETAQFARSIDRSESTGGDKPSTD